MTVLFRRLVLRSAWMARARNRARARRMRALLDLVRPPRRARVIDLGGTWGIWGLIEHDFRVTLVNTSPWPSVPDRLRDRVRIVVADACDLRNLFDDRSFDLAFSNSAIEHLGGRARRERFAGEVRRLAAAWWVQAPNPRFLVEAHTGLPLYWQWPGWARAWIDGYRRRRMPDWHDEIASTEPVPEAELGELFPGGLIYRERVFGFVKSFACYRPFPSNNENGFLDEHRTGAKRVGRFTGGRRSPWTSG